MLAFLLFVFKISVALGVIVTAIMVIGTILSFIMNLIGDFLTATLLFVDHFFTGGK
jgi:hypothetical protein